jgi:flagellar protein FlbD
LIQVTRLNASSMVLNSDLIEHIETTPDTVITLTNGRKVTVQERPDEIIARIREYRRSLLPECPMTLVPEHARQRYGS